MKDFVKYARARDQLYNAKVRYRQFLETSPKHRRTPELEQLEEMLGLIVDTVLECFEAGNILAMQLDIYTPNPLPGFREILRGGDDDPSDDGSLSTGGWDDPTLQRK